MNWYKIAQENNDFESIKQYWETKYTVNSEQSNDAVPNTSSIEASFYDYESLPGIRNVSMSDFGGPSSVFYAADDFRKSSELAKQIQSSGYVAPLIIAIDNEGPYILEGAHRFAALHELKISSFPALVVLDKENLVKENELV